MRNVWWVLALIGIFALIRVLFTNFVGFGVIDINDSAALLKLALAFALSLGMLGIFSLLAFLKIANKI